MKKLDGIVEQIVRYQLSRISAASGAEIVAKLELEQHLASSDVEM